jgi:hypothetical protein
MPSNEPRPPTQVAPNAQVALSDRCTLGRSRATLFLLGVLVFCAMAQAFRSATPAVGIDYYQFWAVGRSIARHEAKDIYSARGRAQLGNEFLAEAMRSANPAHRTVALSRRVFDTTATPFLYTLFGACSTPNYASNLQAYRALLLGCFAFSVVGIMRLLRQTTVDALLSLALLCLWFEPLASDLRVGNVGCLQLAGIVAYAGVKVLGTARFKALLAGTFMGLLVALKPNLVLVALLPLTDSLLRRKWKDSFQEAAGIAFGASIAVGCSVGAIGSIRVWLDWLIALRNVPDEIITADFGNYSPLVILGSKFGRLAKLALAMSVLGAVALGFWLQSPDTRNSGASATVARRVFWLLSLGCLAPILLPHLAWLHYFVLTVPALLYVLSDWTRHAALSRGSLRLYLAAGAWLGLSINPLSAVGITFTNTTYGTLVVTATVALLIATVASFNPTASSPRQSRRLYSKRLP